MTAKSPDRGEAPSLDAWRAEVGDQAIGEVVADTKRQIELSLLPGFSTRVEFLAFRDSARPRQR
jgi:hypothetical protein